MNKKKKRKDVNYILIEEYNVDIKQDLQKIFNKKLYNLIMLIEKNSFRGCND